MTSKHKQCVKFLPLEHMSCLTRYPLLPYLIFFNFCDDIIDSGGAGGVASKIDVIPLHAAKRHELEDALFVEGKGGCSHEVRAILRAW